MLQGCYEETAPIEFRLILYLHSTDCSNIVIDIMCILV